MEARTLTVKPPGFHLLHNKNRPSHVSIPVFCRRVTECTATTKRRDVLITPLLAAVGAYALQFSAVAKAEETTPRPPPSAAEAKEGAISSRIYDATAIGEPLALGKEKRKAWEKMMNARIVYLGEAEQVPTRDDKEVELEIVKNLRKRCVQVERPISLALEAIPSDLQEQLNGYMDGRFYFSCPTRKLIMVLIINKFIIFLASHYIYWPTHVIKYSTKLTFDHILPTIDHILFKIYNHEIFYL